MSRRRGEFEHRTSIFEGAFRAWSHLGGLEPEDLEQKSASDLDPLTNPIDVDTRLMNLKKADRQESILNPDGSKRREYAYEPLPRAGLAHPYVQAILSPWLGADADHDAIQLGLTTLRTWWQHRRKGESGSAIAALGTEKMRGVVEGYTRHFFNLAHCLIVNDKEQPPRSLHGKMKELEKQRSKRNKKRAREEEANKLMAIARNGVLPIGDATEVAETLQDPNLTPLERLHAAQQRQLLQSGGVSTSLRGLAEIPIIDMKGKCIPGKLDLPEVVEAVNHAANQLAHRGGAAGAPPPVVVSASPPPNLAQYGDPNTTPVVFVSENGDIQIAMQVDGITCAHCVKIVETVLKGCNGNKSPIDGLLDAAADRALCSVLIKIDKSSNAKRIAFEAARNLAMVGYQATSKEMSVVGEGGDKKSTMDLGVLSTAFDVVATTDPKDVFDWSIPCTCPDNGVLREDCARHSQMNTRIFEAFDAREKQVAEYMAGCGRKYGMACTCGDGCRCKNCTEHCKQRQEEQQKQEEQTKLQAQDHFQADSSEHGRFEYGWAGSILPLGNHEGDAMRVASRNPSVVSYGNGVRHMSITSETTFGRAMSGLSALSIDWENMEDFDITVDHSSHIDNTLNTVSEVPSTEGTGGNEVVMKRSSLRRSFASTAAESDGAHVSFRV